MHALWKDKPQGIGVHSTRHHGITTTTVSSQQQPGAPQQEEEVRQGTPQNHGAQFRRGLGKRIRSTSPAVGRTPRHTPLLTVKVLVAGEWVEAVVDSGASAPVIGKRLACKLGVWKRARKVRVKQGDGSGLEGGYVANTSSKVIDAGSQSVKFRLDTEVLDIGDRDCILGLSWLVEYGFSVDNPDRCLRNVNNGQVIPCSVRWIPSVLLLDLEEEPLEDGEVLLIIDASERYHRYAQCFSAEQAARLPEHKSWDH